MVRMVLLGLLIPLGVGVLSAMELRTPPRSEVAVVQPLDEPAAGSSESQNVLAKADRLEIAAASSETPAQPALAEERTSPAKGIGIASPAPPRVVNRHRHDAKSKKVTTAALPKSKPPKSKPKATDIKRTTISARSKAASNTVLCRLSEFGGLRKALNSADCEI